MQGRHEEDPTACPFKIYDLQDDGYATDDKHNAEQRNKQQISRKNAQPAEKAAQRQRTGVPHKYARFIRVETQKTRETADKTDHQQEQGAVFAFIQIVEFEVSELQRDDRKQQRQWI